MRKEIEQKTRPDLSRLPKVHRKRPKKHHAMRVVNFRLRKRSCTRIQALGRLIDLLCREPPQNWWVQRRREFTRMYEALLKLHRKYSFGEPFLLVLFVRDMHV